MATPDMGIYGDNVTVTVFIDGTPQPGTEYANSVKIKQEATIHKRHHLGRKRQRVGKQIDGYTVSLAMDLANTTLKDRLAERDAKRDNNENVPELAVGLRFTLRTGDEAAYLIRGCEHEEDIDASERTSEVGFNLEITAEDCIKIA